MTTTQTTAEKTYTIEDLLNFAYLEAGSPITMDPAYKVARDRALVSWDICKGLELESLQNMPKTGLAGLVNEYSSILDEHQMMKRMLHDVAEAAAGADSTWEAMRQMILSTKADVEAKKASAH